MSAHESMEQADQAKEASSENRKIALLIAIIALCLALSETFGKAAQTESIAKNVEAANPECHRRGQQQDPRVERSPHRDPRRCGRNAERESQHQVRPSRYPLGVRVKQQHRQCHRRQHQR